MCPEFVELTLRRWHRACTARTNRAKANRRSSYIWWFWCAEALILCAVESKAPYDVILPEIRIRCMTSSICAYRITEHVASRPAYRPAKRWIDSRRYPTPCSLSDFFEKRHRVKTSREARSRNRRARLQCAQCALVLCRGWRCTRQARRSPDSRARATSHPAGVWRCSTNSTRTRRSGAMDTQSGHPFRMSGACLRIKDLGLRSSVPAVGPGQKSCASRPRHLHTPLDLQ